MDLLFFISINWKALLVLEFLVFVFYRWGSSSLSVSTGKHCWYLNFLFLFSTAGVHLPRRDVGVRIRPQQSLACRKRPLNGAACLHEERILLAEGSGDLFSISNFLCRMNQNCEKVCKIFHKGKGLPICYL